MEAKGVIHLEFKATGLHRYFGSPSAMYDNYTSQELGIARQSLLNYWQKTEKPYENTICIIRKGELERKSKNIMKSKEQLLQDLNEKKVLFGEKYNINVVQVDLYVEQYVKEHIQGIISDVPIEELLKKRFEALDFIDDMEKNEVGSGEKSLKYILSLIS